MFKSVKSYAFGKLTGTINVGLCWTSSAMFSNSSPVETTEELRPSSLEIFTALITLSLLPA